MRTGLRKWISKAICFTLLSGLIVDQVAAQYKPSFNNPDIKYVEERGFSLGFTLGSTDLWADVGTESVIDHYINSNYYNDIFKNMRAMGSIFGRYTYVPGISFRLGIGYGQLYATDAWNEDKAMKAVHFNEDVMQRYLRNFDVHVNLWEGSLLFEFAPLQLINWSTGNIALKKFQPYLIGGVSGFYFKPRGTFTDLKTGKETLVELQPLRTEGQGYTSPDMTFPDHYSLWSGAGIAGIGFKVEVGAHLSLGLEYQLRFAFTDYLDDVSGQYIDPLIFDIAHQGDPQQAYLAQRMADKSLEIYPGMKHQAGFMRGTEGNDKFSSISFVLYWKLKGRAQPWW